MEYVFSTTWRNLDVAGINGTFVNGVYRTSDEDEAKRLRKNTSVIEITQAFEKPKEEHAELTSAEKAVEGIRKRKPKIVAGARLTTDKEQ